jgi:cell wall assembly regulator SMI1
MTKSTKLIIATAFGVVLGGTVLAALAVVAVMRVGLHTKDAFYPDAGPMPPVVSESMDEVLARFEAALQKHAPDSLQHLQPGLSTETIAELERAGGFQLPEEMRALYRWRNGVPPQDFTDIIPIHRFRSLEEVVEIRKLHAREREQGSAAMRAFDDALFGHRTRSIPIFEDIAGDGYFYDPERRLEEGAVYYNFLETGTFQFYPSLKNLLVGLSECYETGAYSLDAEGRIEADYDKSAEILSKYGVDRVP